MKILWITLESILPANSGGRIGIFRRLEQVSKSNDVYLFYTMDSIDDMQYVEDLKKYCKEVHGFRRKKKSIETFCSLLRAPFTVASRKNLDMINSIKKCLRVNNIDLINVDSPHMGLNLLELNTNLPIIMNQHNVEWKVYENIASATANPFKSWIYKIDAIRFKNFEEYLYKKINISMMTFVSSEDQAYFKKKYPNLRTNLVPVGAIDQNQSYNWESSSNNLIFVGKMSYAPNVEAATWFSQNVFPVIKSAIPDAKLYIVGKDPTKEVTELSKVEGIVVTGEVDSLDGYYELADLDIIPLLHGGGVKVKLLEGLGYSTPIVTTPVGVQGTIFNEEYILISKTSEEMVDKCISFLNSRKMYREFYEKTFEVFKKNYTWEAVGENYNLLLKSIANKHKL